MARTTAMAPPVLEAEDRTLAVRDALRDAIVNRRLSPGTKLTEVDVAALFDVSRTVVRAALQQLAFEGLVKSERNRGAFVAYPTPDEARQVFAARRLIEPELARQAIDRLSAEDLLSFRSRLTVEHQILHHVEHAKRTEEIEVSGDFHLLLAQVAGNSILLRFMEELVARSSLVIALYGRSAASSCGHEDHASICEALESRDGDRAAGLIKDHLDHIEGDLDLREKRAMPLGEALSN